jgi:hypothetical protein
MDRKGLATDDETDLLGRATYDRMDQEAVRLGDSTRADEPVS